MQQPVQLKVYHVGIYQADSANGVNRVIYSYGQILADTVEFNVVSMDLAEDSYRQEKVGDVIIHHFPRWRSKGLRIPNRLREWIKSLPQDVIFHIHGVFNPANYMICRALVRAGIPFVYTPHDAYSENSLQTHYTAKRAFIEVCEKFMLNNARVVHALTDQSIKDIAQFTQNRILLLPNFIADPGALTSDQLAQRQNIVFLGRLDIFQKGIDLMIQAYHQFRTAYQGRPPAFVLIGPDRDNAMRKIEEQCKALGLKIGEDVIFAGKVSEPEKSNLLYTGRVYLQLSRFEGFGMSVIEALAHAVPLVISREIPLGASIQAHKAGIVTDDVDSAAQALLKMYSLSTSEYHEWVQQARSAYLDLYSPRAIKERVIAMYYDSLQPQGARSIA